MLFIDKNLQSSHYILRLLTTQSSIISHCYVLFKENALFQMPQAFAIKLSTDSQCVKHLACFNTPSTWLASEIPTYQQWVKSGGVWCFSRLSQCMLKLTSAGWL